MVVLLVKVRVQMLMIQNKQLRILLLTATHILSQTRDAGSWLIQKIPNT